MVFLLAAVFLGLLWAPLLSLQSAIYAHYDPFRDALAAGLCGLILAGIYRGSVRFRGKEPTLWLGIAFPLLGSISRTFANSILGSHLQYSDSLWADFLRSATYAYSCLGILVVPLAIVHLQTLGWLHRNLGAWAERATRRSAHHGAYAVGCVVLLLVTEGGRPLLRTSVPPTHRRTVESIAVQYGFRLPAGSRLSYASEDEAAYWFQPSSPIAWPLRDGGAVANPEPEILITQRAEDKAGADLGRHPVKVRQIKWHTPSDETVKANLVRCGEVDYLEIVAR
ncbi:MAG: hypothetical protein ACO1SV_07810 [Fimbriimonas sp.]